MDTSYVGMVQDVQALSREQLLQETRAWQRKLILPTPKQVAAWELQTDAELRGRVLRIRAHQERTEGPLDAAGRQRVNRELEASGTLAWQGKPGSHVGYWVLRQG